MSRSLNKVIKRDRAQRASWTKAWHDQACMVCLTAKAVAGHHIVYAQHLRREKAPMWDSRNCLPICWQCHMDHHGASRRIPVSMLSADALAFADEYGFSYFIDRYYEKEAV